MRFYRLRNLSEGASASDLLFLRREDAERYRETLLWPHEAEGTWPLAQGGELPLALLRFLAEPVELDAVVEPDLDGVALRRGGVLGAAPLLPGDCFDPGQWRPRAPEEREQPARAAAWERAEAALKGVHRT